MFNLYYMKFDTGISDETKDLLMRHITESRRTRVLRRKSRDASVKCLLTGLFARYALHMAGYDIPLTDFSVGEDEKPYIVGNPVFYNLSHSGDYVVAVVGDMPCGIDLQAYLDANDRLAGRILSKAQYDEYEKTAESEKGMLLTKLWTEKEAYLKYTGEGIRVNLQEIDRNRLLCGFYMFGEIAGYAGCVCAEKSPEIQEIQETAQSEALAFFQNQG